MKIKIIAKSSGARMPYKKYDKDFCYDVYATSREQVGPNLWKYGIGLAMEIDRTSIPEQFKDCLLDVDFRPRSSIKNTGFVLSNCVGTVDELYRGEISAYFYKVAEGNIYEVGDRILQCKLGFTLPIEWEWSEELSETERGEGGYCSTGLR